MKKLFLALFSFLIFGTGCKESAPFEKALDPLDAGRNYLEGVQQGDFKKAHFYILNDSSNETTFNKVLNQYHSLDKEGRQQMRLAAIQINEIANIDPKTVLINYQLSIEGHPSSLKVIETQDGWKVDLK
jgi:hypothetical protein